MRGAALLLASLLPLALAHGQATGPAAGWTIEMRQVRLPVAHGECGPIELVVRDGSGNAPVSPDGKQLSWHDFDFTLTEGADAFRLGGSGNILCASAPGASGVVTARYPESGYLGSPNGKGRTGKQLIPGAAASATLAVRSAGTAPASATGTIAATPLPTSLPPLPTTTATAYPPPAPVATSLPPAPVASGANTPAAHAGMTPVTGESPPTPVIGTATPAPGAEPTLITGTLSPPRITLVGFTAAGWWGRPPPAITLAGFTGAGWWGLPPPRIRIQEVAGVGEFAPPP